MGKTWKWALLHPDQEHGEEVPCRRAAFGGMLSYDGCVYLFGGIKVMYGRPKGAGDLSVQGSLNDLWRYNPSRCRWTRLEGHDGRIGFRPSDARPCTRKLTAWLPVNGRLYLFGGSSVQGPGKREIKLNDLWTCDPKTATWELIEPDDGRASGIAVDGHRPAGSGGMGAAVLGDCLYLMGGHGAMTHAQLWTYKVWSGNGSTWGRHPMDVPVGHRNDTVPCWPAGTAGSTCGAVGTVRIEPRSSTTICGNTIPTVAPGPAFRRTRPMMLHGLPLVTGWDTL